MDDLEFEQNKTPTKEQLEDYRYSRDMELRNADTLDKTIFSLSSIFIGLVVGFLKEIKGLSCFAKLSILLTMGLFIATLFFAVVSYIYGRYEHRCYQRDALQIKYHNLKIISLISDIINYVYNITFCLGLISLFIFFYLSLVF